MEEKFSVCKKGNVEIAVKGVFYDDAEELYYQHPITGEWEQYLDQVFYGWSEQDEQKNEEWNELKEAIEKDDLLLQKVWDDIEEIKY